MPFAERLFASYRVLLSVRTSTSTMSRTLYAVNDRYYGLTEDQITLRKTVRDYVSKQIDPQKSAEIDKKDSYPELRKFWKGLGALGVLGITAPSEYGGSNSTYLENIITMEEISRVNGALGLSYSAHSNLCVNQIVKHGTKEQMKKYLPKLISGDYVGALAMSEANAGSDVVSMRIRAEKKGNEYILNGSKFWITNGPDADVIVVYAKTDPAKKQHGITAFLVEKTFPGFSTAPKMDKLGMRGSGTCELVFEDCRVPEENVLGNVDEGVQVLMRGLNSERLVLSGGPLGLMQAACEVAFDYVHEREAFNKKIATFQLMQAKMANMETTLSSCRHYVYGTARAHTDIDSSNRECAGVILHVSKNAVQVCLDALQMLGANGYINEYPTGRFVRDAKLYEIGAGTTEIRQLIIGREINKEYSA